MEYAQTKALLELQIALGADEAIGEAPVNRFDVAPAKLATPKKAASDKTAPTPKSPDIDPVEVAQDAASAAQNLEELRAALDGFAHCDLKNGARSLVFSDGDPAARVMIIGEAPGRDEDIQGKPFVGRAGQLLDAMFQAIGHGRDQAENAIYITNILPWRPPQNRDPLPEEVAMMRPFIERHIELANPDILVLMGNHSCNTLLGRTGITRLRGNWMEACGKPVMPMLHPAYLLRNPIAKRDAWHDLLMLQAKLRDTA